MSTKRRRDRSVREGHRAGWRKCGSTNLLAETCRSPCTTCDTAWHALLRPTRDPPRLTRKLLSSWSRCILMLWRSAASRSSDKGTRNSPFFSAALHYETRKRKVRHKKNIRTKTIRIRACFTHPRGLTVVFALLLFVISSRVNAVKFCCMEFNANILRRLLRHVSEGTLCC